MVGLAGDFPRLNVLAPFALGAVAVVVPRPLLVGLDVVSDRALGADVING